MIDAKDLDQLSLRAIVAFASRCVRRVQPLFALANGLPEHSSHLKSIDRAINLAVQFAQHSAENAVEVPKASKSAYRAIDTATDAYISAKSAGDADAANAANAAKAAAYVADATKSACDATDAAAYAKGSDEAKTTAYACAYYAAVYAKAAAEAYNYKADSYTEDLKVLQQFTPFDNDSSIPFDILGPLWSNGEPSWYTEGLKRQEEILAEHS